MGKKIKVSFSTPEGYFWEKIYWGRDYDIASFDAGKFEEFANQSEENIRESCCDQDGRLKHIIRAEHLNLATLKTLCETAKAARTIARLQDKSLKGILTSKSVMNYFNQPSSRTLLSFSTAEAHLGMRREDVRDVRTSSFSKGETEKDSLRTSSSYFDAIVCRHPSDIYDLFAVWVLNNSDRKVHFLNAGSGKREHPTQGVLDYYTLYESFKGDIDGKNVIYVGDCKRGRTIHSLAKILSKHKNQTAIFLAPLSLQIDEETEKYITENGTTVIKESKNPLSELVSEADVVYMSRIQDEHGGSGSYPLEYRFTGDMLAKMKDTAILMHPMPKREEIDPALDYSKDKRIMYWRQQRNGMWARVALLSYVFRKEKEVLDVYNKLEGIAEKIERTKF